MKRLQKILQEDRQKRQHPVVGLMLENLVFMRQVLLRLRHLEVLRSQTRTHRNEIRGRMTKCSYWLEENRVHHSNNAWADRPHRRES
jgi:hypothetical protein